MAKRITSRFIDKTERMYIELIARIREIMNHFEDDSEERLTHALYLLTASYDYFNKYIIELSEEAMLYDER